jgi:hypothetical protein
MNWQALDWIDFLGYAASLSVLATFCMGTMVPLRVIAIGSNVLFASYGALTHIYPVLVLHLILLPVNAVRLVQLLRLIRGIKAAQLSGLSIESLLPLMSRRLVKAGQVLMAKGEKADHMYYLCRGTMRIAELGRTIEAGALLGEIGIFARNRRRTATVVCVSDCEIYEISESKAKQIYFQNPSFGFALIELVIDRLSDNGEFAQIAPTAT